MSQSNNFLCNLNHFRVSPSIVHSRRFASEEAAKEQPELSEKEKELMAEVEKCSKEIETLGEKNKELDVSLGSRRR